jgi:hypothetical protein
MKARSSRGTIASSRNEGAKKRYRPCKNSGKIRCANGEILWNETNAQVQEVMKYPEGTSVKGAETSRWKQGLRLKCLSDMRVCWNERVSSADTTAF